MAGGWEGEGCGGWRNGEAGSDKADSLGRLRAVEGDVNADGITWRVAMGGKMARAAVTALAVAVLLVSVLSVARAEGEESGRGEGGGSVKLVVTIAAIWLAILSAVITVVVVTRRKAGEEDRQSKEG